ncbi:MAG TPA: hypothetical protein VH062_31005 [Polyangiaceae bacterium]|nr:hypothetical protein [Polyangiaceae bacterium]
MASHDTRLQEGDEDPEALVDFLERQLRTEPAPSEGELASLRVRLATLYLEKLDDPLSAAVHIEELLHREELEPEVLAVASALLNRRPTAARIAEKLAAWYARRNEPAREADMLAVELTVAKPDRVDAVKRRLAELRRDVLGDPAGAMELLGPLVLQDTDDAELLRRYVDAATVAEKTEDAIRVLSSAHDIAMGRPRARLGYALGLLYLQEGELPSARAAFLSSVHERVNDEAVRASARRIVALSRDPEDPSELAPALEVLAEQEPDVALRKDAAERLLALGVFTGDDVRAIPAWQALLDSERAPEALERLEALYEKAGNVDGLAAILHVRALRESDAVKARAFAFRSAALRSEHGGHAALEAWNFLLDTYGPARDIHERLIPLLEASERWVDVCERLEADAALAPPADAAAALARVGQVRLTRLSQEDAALAAFVKAVGLDPTNALARVCLERLAGEGGKRLEAATALETASKAAGSDEGVLSALETKAELAGSPEEALVTIARAVEIAERDPERATRGLLLAGRALRIVAEQRPAELPVWTKRVHEFAASAGDAGTETAVVLEAAQACIIDGPERVELACAAVDLLAAAGRGADALALSLRALESSPGALALSKRVDRLTDGREPPEARLARYETTLEALTDAVERRELRHAVAELARDGLADLPRAAAEWRVLLAEDPSDERAQRSLVDAFRKTGEASFLPAEMDGVMSTLDVAAQSAVLAAKARSLVAQGERDAALELCRSLVANPDAGDDALESVATLAYEENEQDVYREALERLASSGTASVRVQALERLGHHFEQVGNRRAAAESWKPAAMLAAGTPAGDERARELYERVLAATPDDFEAAERLLELYVSEGRWVNVPGIYATLLRASSDPGTTAKKLLLLEPRAIEARAVDDFVGMLDETVPYLGSTNDEVRRSLMLAKARVLAANDSRAPEASDAYRALIEAGGGEPAITAYEAFVKRRDTTEQHRERRWLFEWRSARSGLGFDAYVAWAKEEESHGETLPALRAYERAAELEPSRDEPFDALSRLRAAQGDFEGALGALRTIRERATGERREELDLRIARLLGEELGRPEEALVSVAPLLSSSPPAMPAFDLARRALERAEELDRTVELVERASNETTDPKVAAANLELLLEAPLDEQSLGDRRESWLVRLSELRADDPPESLRVLAKGIAANPRSDALWEAFIARAKSAKRADAVYEAFTATLEHPSVDAAMIEALGKRTIAFYDEWSSDSAEVQKALEAVLEHVPAARWAIDRLKLLLFAGERWPALFQMYDRAIDGARDATERAELLDEAALTARDLSRDAPRAISYLEQLRAFRPFDAPVQASLERLYEREGESAKLIALLSERITSATGIVKEELEQRIANLWLDLGDLGSAHALVENMLENGVRLADVVPLLERILGVRPSEDVFESPRTPHSRAVALLVEHHQAAGALQDVIRVRDTELSFARAEPYQRRVVESLVGLYLEAGGGGDEAFIAAIPRVAAFGERDPMLARAAAAKLLTLAEAAWTRRQASPDSGAAQAAYWSVRKLEDAALSAGEAEEAVRVLLHGAELAFIPERRRALVRDAAIHRAERTGNPSRAVELFERLFAEDPTDDVVTSQVDRFARLLEGEKDAPARAELWESFGRRAVDLGHPAHGRGYQTMAAELWETAKNAERAIAARRASASLGSDPSLEILGRLHRERGEWRPAAEALEWAFAAAGTDAKARLGSLLADAYLELGERSVATDRLESVLDAVPDANDVRARLAQLYRDDDAFRPLAELLVKGAKVTTSADLRLPMLREAADVLMNRLGEPERAIPILEAATSLAGADAELALSLAGALDAAGRHADAVRVLRAQIAVHGELKPKSRATVHHRLAQVLLHLKSTRDALTELRVATEIDPSNPEMLYDLGRRALEENELGLAESTYRALLLSLHRVEPGKGPSRVDVYLDLSEVAARRNDHARAADYIESSFDVSLEGLEEALRLEKALAARGRDDLVARSVERRLRAAKDPVIAAEALGELLALDGLHRAGAGELPVTIARHAAEIGKQIEEADVSDARVWTILATAAMAGGGDAARIDVLGRRVALLTKRAGRESDAVALGLLREAASSCESDLADVERARRSYEAIVLRFPADRKSWAALFRLSSASGDAERLDALVDKALAKTTSVDERSELRFAFAKTLLDDPKRSERAIAVLEKLLDEAPGHAVGAELLADALEHKGRHAELVTLLESRFAASKKAGRVPVALALRLGTALERSDGKPRAVEVYDAIVADESADAAALDAVRLRLEALSAPSLADCLERILTAPRTDAAPEPELATRLVKLRDEVGDAPGALRAAAIGFELDPRDAALRERLVKDFEARGLPEETRAVLSRAVAANPDDRPLFLAWIDAAVRSGDRDAAIAALDRALAASPSDTELLRERARARQDSGRDEEALADLERAYELDPSFAFDVRKVLERLVEKDGAGRERHVLALVDVLGEQGEQARAGELLERLLDERPEHVGALERLAALRAANQDWPVAIAAYERLLPLVGGDHEQFARLSLAFADACDRAGGSAQARAALERAYEHAPDRADLRERLETIYEAAGDRERLAALLLESAERATEAPRKASLYFRAAELLLKDDATTSRALTAAEAGREADPASVEGALLHARALRAEDREQQALGELLGLAERLRGKSGAIASRVQFEIGRIYLDADYLHEGLEALKLSFQLDPRNLEAAYMLGQVAIDLCDETTASRALRAVTAAKDDKVTHETKAMAFYHLARLAQWKSDKRRAITMAKSALGENPDCDVAKALLESLGH